MSLLLNSNGGNPYLIVSKAESLEPNIDTLTTDEYSYDSRLTNAIPILSSYELPTIASVITRHDEATNKYISFLKIATSTSTGNAKTLFDSVNNETINNTIIFVVYNTIINKSTFCIGNFNYAYEKAYNADGYYRATLVGKNLKVMFRYSGYEGSTGYVVYDYKGNLRDISIASYTNETEGMEFINNPTGNIISVFHTSLTYDIVTSNLLQYSGRTLNSIELDNKSLLLNGVNILTELALAVNKYSTTQPWLHYSATKSTVTPNANGDYRGVNSGTRQLLTIMGKLHSPINNTELIVDSDGIHYSAHGIERYGSIATTTLQRAITSIGTLSFPNDGIPRTLAITVASSKSVMLIVYPYASSASYRIAFMLPIFLTDEIFGSTRIFTEQHGGQGNYLYVNASRTSTSISLYCDQFISYHSGLKVNYAIF